MTFRVSFFAAGIVLTFTAAVADAVCNQDGAADGVDCTNGCQAGYVPNPGDCDQCDTANNYYENPDFAGFCVDACTIAAPVDCNDADGGSACVNGPAARRKLTVASGTYSVSTVTGADTLVFGTHYHCTCGTGYGGARCSTCEDDYFGTPPTCNDACTGVVIASATEGCNDHGTCNNMNAGVTAATAVFGTHWNCACETGYTGDHCTQCAANYYSGTLDGSAEADASAFVCVDACTAAVTAARNAGRSLAVSADTSKLEVCNNHGTCTNLNPGRGRDLAIAAKNPVFGIDIYCNCDTGYGGDQCGLCVANYYSSAANGGDSTTCVDACTAATSYTVTASSYNYYGRKLATASEARVGVCNNRGTCVNMNPGRGRELTAERNLAGAKVPVFRVDISCTCDAGYTGDNCEMCAPNYYTNAAAGGDSTTCVDACTAAATQSLDGVCGAHGTCQNMNPGGGRGRELALAVRNPTFLTDFNCVCDTGYTGANCEQCAANYYSWTLAGGSGVGDTCVDACTAAVAYTPANAAAYQGGRDRSLAATAAEAKLGVCNNHGTCVNMNPGRGRELATERDLATAKQPTFGTDVQCDCDTGYTGTQCEQCAANYYSSKADGAETDGAATCVDACTAHAEYGLPANGCGYHGTCHNLNPGRGRALALAAKVPTLGTDYDCTCDTGYTGTKCDQCAANYYSSTAAGGTGEADTCVDACTALMESVTGQAQTAEQVRAGVCNNHGTCVNMNPGRGRELVTERDLAVAKVPVFGTDVSCDCDTGYTGARCDQCAANYYPGTFDGGNGLAADFVCVDACTAAVTTNPTASGGRALAASAARTRTEVCSDRGTCTNLNPGRGRHLALAAKVPVFGTDLECTCDTGYTGDRCDICAANYYSNTATTSASNVCVDACTAGVAYPPTASGGRLLAATAAESREGVCNNHGTCTNMKPGGRGRSLRSLATAKAPVFGVDVRCDCDLGYQGDRCTACGGNYSVDPVTGACVLPVLAEVIAQITITEFCDNGAGGVDNDLTASMKTYLTARADALVGLASSGQTFLPVTAGGRGRELSTCNGMVYAFKYTGLSTVQAQAAQNTITGVASNGASFGANLNLKADAEWAKFFSYANVMGQACAQVATAPGATPGAAKCGLSVALGSYVSISADVGATAVGGDCDAAIMNLYKTYQRNCNSVVSSMGFPLYENNLDQSQSAASKALCEGTDPMNGGRRKLSVAASDFPWSCVLCEQGCKTASTVSDSSSAGGRDLSEATPSMAGTTYCTYTCHAQYSASSCSVPHPVIDSTQQQYGTNGGRRTSEAVPGSGEYSSKAFAPQDTINARCVYNGVSTVAPAAVQAVALLAAVVVALRQ